MSPAELARLTLLVVHFCGLAAIIGPFFAQLTRTHGFHFRTMLAGSIVQLASGVLLVAARHAADLPVAGAKIGVKLAVALAILVGAVVAVAWQRRLARRGRSDRALRPLLYAVGIAAIGNVAVAVLWT